MACDMPEHIAREKWWHFLIRQVKLLPIPRIKLRSSKTYLGGQAMAIFNAVCNAIPTLREIASVAYIFLFRHFRHITYPLKVSDYFNDCNLDNIASYQNYVAVQTLHP